MFLLAIQYSIQPRLTRKYLDKRTHKQTATLVEEVVKSSLAAALFCATPKSGPPINQQWTLQSSLVVAGIPAVLYAAQGVMTYSSQQHLDSVTFNGITQTKTLSAALFCYLLLQQNQSPIQLLALAGLLISSFLFQGINPFISRGDKEKFHFAKGVLPCLGATAISGLAGALSQKGVQITGVGGRDPFLYAMEVAGYSGTCLLVSMMVRHFSTCSATTALNFGKAKNWFAHWNYQTLWPVTVKAAGGILTVLVHKHAGSVAKGFSLMFGLVLSGILQTFLDDRDMAWHHVMGTLLVMLSGWAHFTHPPM
jgi:UDP-sugar transporter A1/2/3